MSLRTNCDPMSVRTNREGRIKIQTERDTRGGEMERSTIKAPAGSFEWRSAKVGGNG